MKAEQLTQAALGVSAVVLAYALWKHFGGTMPAKASILPGPPLSGSDPTKPDHGWGFDPYNPGELIMSGDLVKGTIADVYAGQTAGDEIPWLSDLFGSTIKDYYAAQK